MARKTAEPVDLVALALGLIEERGWRGFCFTELARRAELPVAGVYAELPDRGAILRRLGRRLDAQMLEVKTGDLDELSPRERLFELIMRRLDAMTPFKAGLRVLGRQAGQDPALLVAGMCNLARLAARLLDAAEVRLGPTSRMLALKVLAAIYVRVFNVWLDDSTPDLARTLAELDRRLQQAESLARWTVRPRRRAGPEEAAAV